ncbi:TPA: ABC transporter ATP-binding protein [Candidatus Falkowbacteria bacterium]|nr:ABC transporter ATP-binding protein [Candidatus Falkowbacteria bacterium]
MSAAREENHVIYCLDMVKAYGANVVLDDIDFKVSRGEFVTVVGPSGCGKSTMLRLILGQERHTSGTMLIDGREIYHPDVTRGIVFQRYSLFPHLTAMENVMIGKLFTATCLELLGSMETSRDEAMYYLKKVGLEDDAKKKPHQLSGGQQQRVAIAQALIMKPEILMMDEPYGALDPYTREDLQMFILEVWEETGMTIFFVTHDLEEAVFLGSRVVAFSQYYSDGRHGLKHGARIVSDYDLGRSIKSTEVKKSPAFSDLIHRIRHESFEPKFCQSVKAFNQTHPDSFMTLTEEQGAVAAEVVESI